MSRAADHTSGPWKVLPHPEGETFLEVIAGEPTYPAGGPRVRAKWIAELDADSLDAEPEENEANARLISAAPDLLEACRELDKLDCCTGYSLSDADYSTLWRALELARGAIAKATGEAHS
jgi:hypothetical protein